MQTAMIVREIEVIYKKQKLLLLSILWQKR